LVPSRLRGKIRLRLRPALLTLGALLPACSPGPVVRIPLAEYQDRVHGGWLAQNIGNIYGIPFEFKYIHHPGPDPVYDPDYAKHFPPELRDGSHDDDDTLLEVLNLSIVERHGLDPTWKQIGDGWRETLTGGVYVANERALELIRTGVLPPDTSLPANNPFSGWNLAGQFTQEMWGLMAPALPAEAQRLADRFARVSVRGEAVLAAHFVAMLHAEAFVERDPETLVRRAAAALPPGSAYRGMIEDVLTWRSEYGPDWRMVRAEVHGKYFGHPPARWNANSCVINGAMCVIALLYGGGDFDRTLKIAIAAGDDADCNAATALGVCGVWSGASGIPERWKAPLHDRYRIRHLKGFPKETTISGIAARIAAQGVRLVRECGGRIETEGHDAVLVIPRGRPAPVMPEPAPPPKQD
jgi:hypothetical protein